MFLREVKQVRQTSVHATRRWFTSHTMDLIILQDETGDIVDFSFCYDKGKAEKALTWSAVSGLRHCRVNDGEGNGALSHKAAPLLTSDIACDFEGLGVLVKSATSNIPPTIAAFILRRIAAHIAP